MSLQDTKDAAPSLMQRVREAAQEARRRAEAAARDPEEARRQKDAQEAARAAALAAYEDDQWAHAEEALTAYGLKRKEVRRWRAGLSEDWEALRAVRAWLKEPEVTHLLLIGATGTGKTLAGVEAVVSCRFWYAHPDFGRTWAWPDTIGTSGLFVLSGDVATLSYYGQDTAKWREKLCGCRLLVLDELGTEVMSAGWLSLLDTVINQRHRAGRKTLLLTNLDPATFKARYGERVARRVNEEGRALSLGAVTLSGGAR